MPSHPGRIRDLAIIAVTGAAERARWNTLIARERPHGMTTFAGCQVRYLVGSAHGWLGAAGFAAAARLTARLEALAAGAGPTTRPCERLMRGVRETSGLTCLREGAHYLILREKPEALEVVEIFHEHMDIEGHLERLMRNGAPQ